MPRKRKQIAAERFDINRNFTDCLHRVGMKPDFTARFTEISDEPADFLDRLNRPDFIVRGHHGN